jgi:hypothetical protein
MKRNIAALVGVLLAVTMLLTGCLSTREQRVRKLCRFIRPDMMLSDANELFGWQAKFDTGDWYWTNSRRFIVHCGNRQRIVEVYDSYRLKSYHKMIDRPGVFERDFPRADSEGNAVSQPENAER